MKLSPEQYKKFKRFTNFLMSEDHNELDWTTYYTYDGSIDEPYGPSSRGYKVDGIENFREEVGLLESIIEEQLPKIDIGQYDNYDDSTGNGTITATFDAQTMSLNFDVDIEITVTHEHTNEKSFDELSQIENDTWNRFKDLKLLGDPEFVEEIRSKYGNEIVVEYDGGGDSGYVQEDSNVPSVMENITYEILELFYSGWEINEGSKGTIVYDFKNRRVTINHDLFETEYLNVEIGEIKLTQ
jgi:hypothetical protein